MPKTADAGPVVGLTIAELTQAYRSSAITPTEVVDHYQEQTSEILQHVLDEASKN